MKKDIDLLNKAYNKVRRTLNEQSFVRYPVDHDYEMAQTMRSGMYNPNLEEETVAEEIEEQYADMDSGMWATVCEILYKRAMKPARSEDEESNGTFSAYRYIMRKYGQDILDMFEEDHGPNGVDRLLSSEDEAEIDELLEDYLKYNQ